MALTAPTGEWTDEQKALRKSLNEYFDALNEGHLEDDAANRFNRDKWDLIRQSGVLRIPFDAEWGGSGHDVLTLVYVLENLGYGCRDTGLLFGAATQVVSAAIPLQKFGSDELKERYLARLVDGEILSAHAISEPGAGSDATAMATTATEDGDEYVINGKKIWITSGPLADVITVYAKTGAEGGAAGITAFLVPTDTPGFHVGEPIEKLGLNTCPFCELEFSDCRVPSDSILGKPGSGFFILEHVMNYEILCIFMMMAGEMQERLDRCIKYAKERQAFGRSIGSNQYIAGKIVDMKIGLENSRKHLYDTARRFNRGRSVTTEISMAKLITSEANVASALSAIQIFGARGYTREYGLEKGLRDAIGAPIYSGTNETQRVRIASMLGL
jgi:alkylation response protein AidB-like acyl-CoA dehydrogenase